MVKRLNPGNKFTTNAWFEVKPGQTAVYTFTNKACVGWSVNGVDRIRQVRESGSIFTGETSELWVHPSQRTDMGYGQSGSNWYLDLSLNGGQVRYQNAALTPQSLVQALTAQGVVKYQCLMAASGNNIMSID